MLIWRHSLPLQRAAGRCLWEQVRVRLSAHAGSAACWVSLLAGLIPNVAQSVKAAEMASCSCSMAEATPCQRRAFWQPRDDLSCLQGRPQYWCCASRSIQMLVALSAW